MRNINPNTEKVKYRSRRIVFYVSQKFRENLKMKKICKPEQDVWRFKKPKYYYPWYWHIGHKNPLKTNESSKPEND